MVSWLLLAALLAQGLPVRPDQGGTITGILRDAAGKPLPSVRVAAIPQEGDAAAVMAGQTEAMSALAETDQNGRYVLDNLPPGRYYIAAGRLDGQTFYPGILDKKDGKTILVAAGLQVTGIDFSMRNESQGRAAAVGIFIGVGGSPTMRIPLDVRVEGGSKVPIFSPRGMAMLKFTPVGTGTDVLLPINWPDLTFFSPPPDYRISVQGLPDGFSVKSMTYGATDLLTAPLVIPAPVFNAQTAVQMLSLSGGQAPLTLINVPAGGGTAPAGPLSIVLSANVAAAPSGVLVAGRVTTGARSIYLSGVPGMLYSDGTFEFRGVRPGRYSIVTLDNPAARPVVASVVVGDRDLDRLEPLQTPVLPIGTLGVRPSPGGPGPSSIVPLAALRGLVSDKDRAEPLRGRVFISGGFYGTSTDLGEDGRFEFSNLLPGDYNIEVQLFRRESVKQRVTVGEDGVSIEMVSAAPEADAAR